jgi:hypothetical protein
MSVTASIVSAIVSSVINAIAEAPPAAPPPPAWGVMARNFPVETKKGELYPPIQQQVSISGKTLYTAPGLQVRNEQNLIVMPGTVQKSLPVRYQLDPMGNVWRIWILSAAEQAAPETAK